MLFERNKMIITTLIIFLILIPNTNGATMKSTELTAPQKVSQIADTFEKAYFDHNPEIGLFFGRTDVALDRFRDRSLKAHQQWQKQEDATLQALNQLKVSDLQGTPQYQTYRLLKETLENHQAVRICKEELWNVNPLRGWHIMLGLIAEKQPVGTDEYRQAALKRYKAFNRVVQDEIDNLKFGVKEGYTAPKPVVETVIKQLKMILNSPLEKSPYFEFAQRDGDPAFKKQTAENIKTVINPALNQFLSYLEDDYLPVARTQIGLSALPHGKQCYQAKIKEFTTLNISPQAIYDYGLEHSKQLALEIAAIGEEEFGEGEIKETFRLAKERSKNTFSSEQDILAYNQAALAKANAAVPKWFLVIPKAPATLKPYPLHRAKNGAPGEYHFPSDDGKRPGIFFINTYAPENKSRVDQESTLYHELIPGHHFQVSLAIEDRTHHRLELYLWNAGFVEGWALYTERLADEMGLYQDNMSRLGMLANESLRTARLVVDPGIHVMNWTREQAIAYMKQHTILEDHIIEGEIDRYTMMPGQATSYMLGKREIETLRKMAENKLGAQFDIREYHHQVLKNGAVSLPMLNENIQAWLQNSQTSA